MIKGRAKTKVEFGLKIGVSLQNFSVAASIEMRVLALRGVALIRKKGEWEKVVKPRPEGFGSWTHFHYVPQGNPVANDSVVGPPRHLQWVSEPRWQTHHNMDQSIAALVSAGGRMFYIVNDSHTRVALRLSAGRPRTLS